MATNYLGTEIGLIWDTLLPGVIPVTLCVAVPEGVTEDTAMLSACAGSLPNTVVSSSWASHHCLPEQHCFFY